jgi:hypothetical protein
MIIEKNARSTTLKNEKKFVKTSHELSLKNEATELQRCDALHVATAHVRALEYVSFDEKTNQLITVPVLKSQTLFNKIWNETSIFARSRGKSMDVDKFLSRAKEIGQWLKLYHDTSVQPVDVQMVSQHLLDTFKTKLDYVRKNKIVDDQFIHAIENRFYPEIANLGDPQYQIENCIRFCRVHGDFNAYNMVVDPHWKIYILDFADTHIGTSIEDIGRFYELLRAISQANAFRQKMFVNASNAFLNAYGLPESIRKSPFLKCIQALNVIIHLLSEHSMGPYVKTQFLTKLELRRLSRVSLNWLTNELGI